MMKHLIVCQECFAEIDANELHTQNDCIKKLKETIKDLQERLHELLEWQEQYEEAE